jgi:hypothetical protein
MDPVLLPPDHPDAPKYWMYETSGVLTPAIKAYLDGKMMTPKQIAAMRAYLRQWISSPVWAGPEIDGLRDAIGSLTSRKQIERWLDRALDVGMDPL